MNVSEILAALTSHAARLAVFDRINAHEPKSAPGSGLSVAFWLDSCGPASGQSGLASTTVRLVFNARIYSGFLEEPQDFIDPQILDAFSLLMSAYSGDFSLGDNVRNVDLLGASGIPLSGQAGYLTQDKKIFRSMTIVIPLICNDVWDQVS